MVHRPFFSFFGSKWSAAKLYPSPRYDTIIEPFAGSAGYALNHWDREVILCDADPIIADLWGYLISVKESEILGLPLIDFDKTVDDYELTPEQKYLIGFWLNRCSSQPKKSPSKRMRIGRTLNRFWGASIRETIASQLKYIRHWRVHNCSYYDLPIRGEATWYVDPPYQGMGKHYRYGSSKIYYTDLSIWCQSRKGQVIVCENQGANWLPFEYLTALPANCLRKGDTHKSHEVIWTNKGKGNQ